MTDYERGVEQASTVYKEVIREYVAENDKLRAERDHMWALRDTWQENDAKLRELVRDMWQTIDGMQEQSNSATGYVFCADVCPRWEVECSKQPTYVCWYKQRMRELGVV